MDISYEILEKLALLYLAAIGWMLWLMKCSLYKKFEKIDQRFEKLDQKIDKVREDLSAEIKDIHREVKDIDRRLCRIEGSLATKDCCVLKEDRYLKKAE